MPSTNIEAAALIALVQRCLGGHFEYIHDTADKPFQGGEYAIFALADEAQRRQIAVRVPKAQPGPLTSMRMEKEIDVRRRIDAARVRRFQPLLACDPTAENDLHHSFMILGWAQGHPLQWSESAPEHEVDRQKVLQAIADISLDLLQVHEQGMSLSGGLIRSDLD
jgi:hypothetical protein